MDSEPVAVPNATVQPSTAKVFADSLLKMALEAALTMTESDAPPDWGSKQRSLEEIALAQAKMGDIAGAKSTARLSDRPWWVYDFIATEQADRNDVDGAIQTFIEVQEGELSTASWWRRLLDLGRVRRCRAAASERSIAAFKCCSDDLLTYIISAQIRNGDMVGAEQAAKCIPSGYVRGKWQRKVARARLAEGDTAGLRELIARTQRHATVMTERYLRALRRADTIARLLRRRSYGLGVRGRQPVEEVAAEQAEIGDVNGALGTLHILGISDDFGEVKGIVDIARIRLRAKDFLTCYRLLENALKRAEHIRYRSERREAFLRIGVCAVNLEDGMSLAEAAWRRSEEIGGELGEFAHDYPMIAYHCIVNGYRRRDDIDGMRRCITWDVESSWKMAALGDLAEAYAERGDFAEALATAEKLQGIPDEYCGVVAKIQLKAGDFSAAMQSARQIGRPDAKVNMFRNMARDLARAGAIVDAANAIDAALNAVVKTYQLADVAATQAEIGDFSGAELNLQKTLRQHPDGDRAHSTITRMCKTAVSVVKATVPSNK